MRIFDKKLICIFKCVYLMGEIRRTKTLRVSKFCIELAQVVGLRLEIVSCIVSSQYPASESYPNVRKDFLKIREIDILHSRKKRHRKVLHLFVFLSDQTV